MGDARGEFAERRQLLAHDDLILSPVQIGECVLELFVLASELLGQLLDQVQPLDLERMAAEDLEGCGHVRDLVPPGDLDLGFEIAVGHAPHPVRQPPKTAQQNATDEQPGDQQRPDDADHAEREQQVTPDKDRSCRGAGGVLRARPGRAHQTFGLGHQPDSEIVIGSEKARLTLGECELLGTQIEALIPSETEFEEPGEGRDDPVAEWGGSEGRQVMLDLADGGFEAFLQRFEQGRVGEVEGAGKKLDRDRGVLLQFGHVAVAGECLFRQVQHARRRLLAEFPIAGHGVEQLVVDSGNQGIGELMLQHRNFSSERFAALGQREALGDRALDGSDVRDQSAALSANALQARRVRASPRQDRQLCFEGPPILGDARGDAGEVFRCRRGRQPRRGSHQSAALLRHAEGRRHLRNAAFVHPALDVTNPIEGEPADQTRDDGERDRAANRQIELRREPEAAFEQPSRPGGHGCAGGLSVSIGW